MNIRPLAEDFAATYYDGERAVRHQGRVKLGVSRIEIELETFCVAWEYVDCRLVSDGFYGEPARIETKQMPGAALVVAERDFIEALGQHYAALVARPWWDARLSGWAAILRSAAGALVLGAGIYYYGIGLMAELGAAVAPKAIEERLGDSAVKLIVAPDQVCSASESTRLLARIESRLFQAAGSEYKFRVIHARLEMVNAFAAPGGNIVVSDYLVRMAGSPEEYAGVLAHEIQHVLHRDSMRAISRELGGNALLAMMAVDPSSNPIFLNQSKALLDLSFSRSAEEQADIGAVALLAKAKIPMGGLAAFLNRLLEDQGRKQGGIHYLSTHPDTAVRIETLRKLARADAATEPLLTQQEWQRARDVCR